MNNTIVITGAAGQLGGHVAHALIEVNKAKNTGSTLRFASRDVLKIAALKDAGHETVFADFNDADSLMHAFKGANVALIISGDAPNAVRIEQHKRAIDAAKAAGVTRVVYTSFANPTLSSKFTFAAIHHETEAYLKASGMAYTIVRNNSYAGNLDHAIAGARESGVLVGYGAQGKVAYITHANLGEAIAFALLDEAHANKTYELSGEQAYDHADVAALLSKAGKVVTVSEPTAQQATDELAGFGLPEFLVQAIVSMGDAVNAGEYAATSTDFATLTGHKPTTLAEYLQVVA